MNYQRTKEARFVRRPNRFEAEVVIDGVLEIVHVKNTGRCKELLIPDVEVMLSVADNPNRKTRYDLIAVKKPTVGWINIDSQAPNQVMKEWLLQQDYTYVKPEYAYGDSRIDFYLERGAEKFLVEVKGCTLEVDGQGYFPDAPTERGARHLMELKKAVAEGYQAAVAFVIQMNGIESVLPNRAMDPVFAKAFDDAVAHGVQVWFLCCDVKQDGFEIIEQKALTLP